MHAIHSNTFRMYYTCTCLVLVLRSHVSTLHVVDLHSFCTPRNCFQDYNCPRKEQQQFYKPLWKMVLVIANWIHWSIRCFIGLLIHCYTQHSLIHIVTTAGYNQNANHLYSYTYVQMLAFHKARVEMTKWMKCSWFPLKSCTFHVTFLCELGETCSKPHHTYPCANIFHPV